MPRIDTDRDRRRLRAAILIAAALHGLLFALFAFLPADGVAWVADGSMPGLSGSGAPAGLRDSSGAGGRTRHAGSAGMRVIPILITPLERDASPPHGTIPPRDAVPPRDPAPSRPTNDSRSTPAQASANTRAIAETDATLENAILPAVDAPMDIAVADALATSELNASPRDADSPGASAGDAASAIGSGGIPGAFGTDGAGSFGNAQQTFARWLDSAIRARLAYPERARARNAEGTVVIALTVPADGTRCDVFISHSSGNAILDRAAIELIRSLFPAKVAPGRPFSAPVKICFTLTSASNP